MSQEMLDFQITLASWRRIPRLRARLQEAAWATVELLPSALRFPASANILLTGNAKVRELNRDFRGVDKPTNVLSFPQFEPRELRRLGKSKDVVFLGDIALAYQVVVREAKNDDKRTADHVTHLVVHGLLHLFGYDHQNDSEADRMERAEIRILKSLGLPNPYAPKREK